MAKNIIKEVSVRKDGHSFTFLVRDDGKIDYHIDNGKVYTWGFNVRGQLGDGTENDSSVPICISDTEKSVLKGKNIKNISLSGNTVCALDDNGKVYTWGENNYGQL